MSRFLPLFLASLVVAAPLRADDRVRDVQTELKKQGFYFGDLDGQSGDSTSAAIRRYQIRNGLAITGAIDAETLQALGIGGQEPAPVPTTNQVAPPAVNRGGPPAARPPVDLRQSGSPEADTPPRTARPPSGTPAPAEEDGAPNRPSARFRVLFSGTPYMNAPRVVQEETYARALRALRERGFLAERADAPAAEAVEEGLLTFQRKLRLPLSGQLDLETLGALQLLPGRGVDNPRVAPAGGLRRIPPPRPYPDQFAR